MQKEKKEIKGGRKNKENTHSRMHPGTKVFNTLILTFQNQN